MKKLYKLSIILLILLFPAFAFAGGGATTMMMGTSGAAVATCGDLATARTDGDISQAISDGTTGMVSSAITATASGTALTVYVKISDVGTPPGYLYAYLCPSDGSNPASGTALDACVQSTTTNIGPPGASSVDVKYKFAGYSITNTSVYHIVLNPSVAGDASNYYRWLCNRTATNTGGMDQDADGTPAWTSIDTSAQCNFRVTSCDE